jgi:hypothetical protein
MDLPYDNLHITQPASVNAQVQAALPGSALDQYQFPRSAGATAQILVDCGTEQLRVMKLAPVARRSSGSRSDLSSLPPSTKSLIPVAKLESSQARSQRRNLLI